MVKNTMLTIRTKGRSLVNVTREIEAAVASSGVKDGLCHLFVHHTSASLLISENADPDVLRDLETYFARLVEDGDPSYRHDAEGPDDMAAHIRSALTATSLAVPVVNGRCALGTWQALYLWEHRTAPHERRITVSVVG